jgi:proteasome accessory factor A
MAIKKIVGTETEYGIISEGSRDFDQVSGSLFLINSLPSSNNILWDYENENPLLDLRGFKAEGEIEKPDSGYNKLLNKILSNGGRLYVDGAHPEYSTPECTNPKDLVAYEKAGELIIEICRDITNSQRENNILIYKNNTDKKGSSYGYHENYLMLRDTSFDNLIKYLVPFLVTRQIYCGAGRVGSERGKGKLDYQVSQRSDFIEKLIDLNTMSNRPIINTRDEPHADPWKYRRLHIIIGDSNMSEYSTYLKVGTTLLILDMIEDGVHIKNLDIENPVAAIKDISYDISLKRKIKLADGRELTAIEIQKEYLESAYRYYLKRGMDSVIEDILNSWEYVISKLEKDPMELSQEIDWVIKLNFILSYMERKGCSWNDPRVSMIDLQYHNVDRSKGIYYLLEGKGMVKRVVKDEDVKNAITTPPQTTTAKIRGDFIKKAKEKRRNYIVDWGYLKLDGPFGKGLLCLDPFLSHDDRLEKLFKSPYLPPLVSDWDYISFLP